MLKRDREVLGVLWGAIFLFLNYIAKAISIARAAEYAQGGPWRILAALTALAASICYIQVFVQRYPILSWLFVGFNIMATAVFFMEISQIGINADIMQAGQMSTRISQLLFPLSLVCFTVILLCVRRVPRSLSLLMLLHVLCWFFSYFAQENMALKVTLSFAVNVISFIAFLILMGWLVLFWNAERKEPR